MTPPKDRYRGDPIAIYNVGVQTTSRLRVLVLLNFLLEGITNIYECFNKHDEIRKTQKAS